MAKGGGMPYAKLVEENALTRVRSLDILKG